MAVERAVEKDEARVVQKDEQLVETTAAMTAAKTV